MKHLIILSLTVILISCKRNSIEIITEYFNSVNNKDTSKISSILDNRFKTKYGDTLLNKEAFIQFLADGFNYNQLFEIINATDNDSTILVKVNRKKALDTVLKVKSIPVIEYTFKIDNGLITNMESKPVQPTFDSYNKEYWKKYSAILYYLDDNHFFDSVMSDNPNKRQLITNILTINADKFFQEEKEVQNKYLKTSSFRGKYTCEKCIYKIIEFKGASTCLVLGFYATSYVIDENYIRIRTDKGDLLLKIIDENTLEGEGWAEGHYKKVK